jgi:hypothetical protein
MRAHKSLRITLALVSAAAFGYATWLKASSGKAGVGAYLIGVPVTILLIVGLTYLRLRYVRRRKDRP